MSEGLVQFARQNYNLLVVLAGVSLLGASAGVIGAFAVLRKRALTGDALSHAALPGLCLAFLVMQERNFLAMLLGALLTGILGIAIISALGRWTRVRSDAAIGIVLSVFFGLGVVLLRVIQDMEGVGSRSGLKSYIFGKTAGMILSDVYIILAAGLVCLAAIALLYKEFKLVSFDSEFAQALGWPVYGMDLLLMSLVAAAVVIGLPNVGVVLISALLIMPGAAARFWTDRLRTLLVLAGAFGFATGVAGTLLSARFEQLPAGPIIVLCGAALFLASLLFGWRRGAIARLLQRWQFEQAWRERQLLEALYEAEESQHRAAAQLPPRDLDSAVGRGWVRRGRGGHVELSEEGRRRAAVAVRRKRLWLAYLDAYPEQAGSLANLGSPSLADLVPSETIAELTRDLQAAGRWPRLESES